MKQKFSTSWKSSKQRRKQRKYLANAPLHLRNKLISANLSKELRKKYLRRSFTLRKGDTVKVMRGQFKNKSGKVNYIDKSRLRLNIEGIQRQKKDGTKVNVWFNPSTLQIQEVLLGDKNREKSIKLKIGTGNASKKTKIA
ncbi:MAG: 50S ribosomal protein L24 [archaeon]